MAQNNSVIFHNFFDNPRDMFDTDNMKRLFLLVISVLTFFSQAVLACTCVPKTVQEYFNEADIVFVGEVIELLATEELGIQRVKIKPITLYKGMSHSEFTVSTIDKEKQSGLCGYLFQIDEKVLVYGKGNIYTGIFYTDICQGTKLYAQAQKDIAVLDKGITIEQKKFTCQKDTDCIGVHAYIPPEGNLPGETLISCQHKDAPLKEGEWIANENWNARCVCLEKEKHCASIESQNTNTSETSRFDTLDLQQE